MTNEPSIIGLRAFEAVARLGSVKLASEELFVTPGAITHRVRDLERIAGASLLERKAGVFQPTARGQLVLLELSDAFTKIKQAYNKLKPPQVIGQLRILAPASFASMWLLPRIKFFEESNPGCTLILRASDAPWKEPNPENFDIIIQDSESPPDSRSWTTLFEDRLIVVGAPQVVAQIKDVASVHYGETRAILIDPCDSLNAEIYSWDSWLKKLGQTVKPTKNQTYVTLGSMAITLAIAGQALTLTPRSLAEEGLLLGQLTLVPGSEVTGPSYWFHLPHHARGAKPVLMSFVTWLSTVVPPVNAEHSYD